MGTLRRGLCLAFLERSPVSLRTDGSWQLRRRGLASAAATAVGTATATSISNYPVGLSEVLQERLRTSRARHEELNIKMQNGDVPTQDMGRAYKELSSLAATIDLADRAEVAAREAEEYSELVASTGKGGEAEDPWLHEQAKEELAVCTSSIPLLEASLAESLLPRNVEDDLSAILEVRAGSGGDEGALFAGELLGMYERYARSRNWQWRLLQMSTTDLGGCKEASAEVIGTGAFGALRTESGVHRVQRVPINDVRLHTSAATVAVLPEAPDIDVKLDPKEIKIDVYRSSGAGGQHVNTTESAVRLTHIPTGITVCMQDERSQHQNRAKAMIILKARVYAAELLERRNSEDAARALAVGSGDRSERIRTYNFSQDRVTDHRISLTRHGIAKMLSGGEMLEEFVEALRRNEAQERLKRES